jgi:hypothetical protein
MEELQRWLDAAPTIRQCAIVYDGWDWQVDVGVRLTDGTVKTGKGRHQHLTFAVVEAILDQRKE